MSRPRTDCAERHLVREERLRERLKEETRGLSDCGRASHGRFVQGCRCGACREANRAYEEDRRRRRLYGRPSQFVDAGPVRRKIEQLRGQGYTIDEIERLSGVGHSTLYGIMVRHWRTGRPVERCRRETKDAICTIKGRRRLTQGQNVDAGWMAGWLREYRDAGLAVAQIARTCGLDRQVLDAVLHGKRSRVFARTLHAFVTHKPELDRMAMDPGACKTTRSVRCVSCGHVFQTASNARKYCIECKEGER